MASIRTGIELNDRFSNVLSGVINATNLAVASMEDMSRTMNTNVSTASIEAAKNQLTQASIAADRLNQEMQNMGAGGIKDSVSEQEKLNQKVGGLHSEISRARQGFSGWQKAIIVANNAIGLVKNTLGRLGVMDMGGAFDRIDTMNRFQKTVSVMTGDAGMANAALAALKDTTVGTAYGLDVASKATQGFLTRGMSIGAATEQVRIWADAVSFYGKGTNEQFENVADALGKIYTKGTVEQMQLDRLFDAGIGAAEIYAQAVGKSVSKVKDDLTNRRIDSATFIDTVSKALDQGVSAGAAKQAGGTWTTTFANVKAAIARGWTSTIQSLDSALAAHGLPSTIEMVTMFGQKCENVLNRLGDSMNWLVGAAVKVGETAGSVGGFIHDNWGTIAPVIGGIVFAWGAFNAVLIVYNGIQAFTNMLQAIGAARAAFHAGATFAEAAATRTATGAQVGLNAALLACPITWIIVAIAALIVALVAVANNIAQTGVIATTTFGAICGGIWVVGNFFKNLGMAAANIALGIGNAIAALAYNMVTAFHNGICNIKSFFYDLLSAAVGVIESICKALNKLPFIEFDYSGISAAADDYARKSEEATNNKRQYTSIKDAFNDGNTTFDAFKKDWAYDAYERGAKWGDDATNKIKNMLPKMPKIPDVKDRDKTYDYKNKLGDTALNTSKTADNTAKTAKALEITSEDLKYLRDIAERDVVNRYTTASINVNMTNHNSIGSDMDLDGVTKHMCSTIEAQMNAAAEGVH